MFLVFSALSSLAEIHIFSCINTPLNVFSFSRTSRYLLESSANLQVNSSVRPDHFSQQIIAESERKVSQGLYQTHLAESAQTKILIDDHVVDLVNVPLKPSKSKIRSLQCGKGEGGSVMSQEFKGMCSYLKMFSLLHDLLEGVVLINEHVDLVDEFFAVQSTILEIQLI